MSASIVNVPINQPVYNSSKAAVTHLLKSLAVEWRDFARVNIVSPGYVSAQRPRPASSLLTHTPLQLPPHGHGREVSISSMFN